MSASFAQVGIGTSSPTSKLEVVGSSNTSSSNALKVGSSTGTILTVRNDGQVAISSTTQAFLPPRMTTAQRDAISSPSIGSVIFNTTTSKIQIYKELNSTTSTVFGNSTTTGSATCLSSRPLWFTPTVSGTITQIELNSNSSETASIAIKSNFCATPTLLGTSNTITTTSGWNTWTFASPISVTANTTYFITSDNASNCLGVKWSGSGDDATTGKVDNDMGCTFEAFDPASKITVVSESMVGTWVDLKDEATNLASGVSGTLAINNGGTGSTTKNFVDLSNSQIVSGSKSFSDNVRIGTTSPAASAAFEISSTSQGFLLPRMTEPQRDAITSPVAGLMIFCSNCGTNGELQFYNGTSWRNTVGGTAAGIIYTLGESALGGIVAYILKDGDPGYDPNKQHGLIVSATDISTSAQWGCSGTQIAGARNSAIGTGLQNTLAITNSCATPGIAARLCLDLVQGGYSDWYLPSLLELRGILANKVAIGGFASSLYWSSSEGLNNPATLAEPVTFVSGAATLGSDLYKTNSFHVRAVRSY